MSEGRVELKAILADVRRRWMLRRVLRASTLGTVAAATVLLAGLVAVLLVARDGLPLLVTTVIVVLAAVLAISRALWPCRSVPTDLQVARFVEERVPDLDDVLVTAVEYAARDDASPPMRAALGTDAVRALDVSRIGDVVPRRSLQRAGLQAAALVIVVVFLAPALSRATNVASAYLFPTRLHLVVSPGTTKVRAGEPLTISATIDGSAGELVPTLAVGIGDESRAVRMVAGEQPGTFAVTIERVSASFAYHVAAAGTRSDEYSVTVIRPPRVERIDLHYEFPRGLGLEPRTDEDSGDVYGPAGTKVRLTVTADKPIAAAALLLSDGTRVPLDGESDVLEGGLVIDQDGSYRIALADHDGLDSVGDTEYFIRTLADRPPDVRIIRPASDRKVTPLEEVLIEVRADDDHGIASLDLVFQTPGTPERIVPLRGATGRATAAGTHTLFLEDLGVEPGDFVTYYARARDVNRGRRSVEARSDIFFLEVKPFEEEFVAAQSQSMGGGGMQGATGIEGLADAQKQIIVATWKLDARARRARDGQSREDIQAISKAQSELRARTEQASAQVSRTGGDPRRRRAGAGAPPTGDDPLGRASAAMGRAVQALDTLSTTDAMPHEMEALNQLLKAEAEMRRRQVSRQQQAGGGGGANRAEADLSSPFDQELRRRQETNYETPNSTETREETPQEDPLERIRELARRQDAINRQQRDMARDRDRMEEEELKRQLERLTREQNELRQQAEQLAQRMQQDGRQQSQEGGQGQSQGQAGGRGSSGEDGRRLREISEDMRNAATGLRRQDAEQATESGNRASERLRDLERQMQTARPDERRRALRDLQLETRQLADAQRRLATEAGRTARGSSGDDPRRRLAGEQERLAERAERLQEQVGRMSQGNQGADAERQATDAAARELERQRLADRMRRSADALRQPSGSDESAQPGGDAQRMAAREGEEVARALDNIADRLGAASGAQDADSRRLSDQLGAAQELRDTISELERSIERLRREGQQSAGGQRGSEQDAASRPSAHGQEQQADRRGPQQAQGGEQGQQTQGSQQSAQGSDGRGGQQGGSSGGQGGRLEQLQQDVSQRMRDAERLAEQIRRDNPEMQMANPSEGWWRSVSAPGTEAFKQDFARWESLKKNLLVAIETIEDQVSSEIRHQQNKERLNAGGHEAVGEAYRDLVDKYYRSLAAPRKPQ
jgi:hypothetical protein